MSIVTLTERRYAAHVEKRRGAAKTTKPLRCRTCNRRLTIGAKVSTRRHVLRHPRCATKLGLEP